MLFYSFPVYNCINLRKNTGRPKPNSTGLVPSCNAVVKIVRKALRICMIYTKNTKNTKRKKDR